MYKRFNLIFLVFTLSTNCLSTSTKTLQMAPNGTTFSASGDYLIGNGDIIGVSIHGDQTLTGSYNVDERGEINIPLINSIHASGLTVKKLKKEIEVALKNYIQTPKLAVSITDRKSFHAYFCGEINKTGIINFSEPTTLLQGLGLAGGLTPFSSERIIILRKTKQGVTERYSVKYEDLLKGGPLYDTFNIERGDTIIAE